METEKARKLIAEMKKHGHLRYLEDLMLRWEQEKKYEDFDDYANVIKKKLNYLKIQRVTKRPFGIIFRVGNSLCKVKFLKKGQKLVLAITLTHKG